MLVGMDKYQISPRLVQKLKEYLEKHINTNLCIQWFSMSDHSAMEQMRDCMHSFSFVHFNDIMPHIITRETEAPLITSWKDFILTNQSFIETDNTAQTLAYLQQLNPSVTDFKGCDLGLPWETIDIEPEFFEINQDGLQTLETRPRYSDTENLWTHVFSADVFDASSIIIAHNGGRTLSVFDTDRRLITHTRH
jgi:hypothetical protein